MKKQFVVPCEAINSLVGKKLNGVQYSVLIVIWKSTYGAGEKAAFMSLKLLQDLTGYSDKAVKAGLNFLLDKKVVIITQGHTAKSARRIMFNEDYGSWKL